MSDPGRRDQGADRPQGPDHRRALHGAGARPSRARLLHEPRSVRRDGRFHHGAGNLADVRRADRPVGGGGLVDDGRAESGPADRARAGPRHADERRAARGAHRAGVSRRARRLARSRRARRWRRCSTNCCSTAGAPIAWAQIAEGDSGRTGDRHRQRVSRRAAGPPVRAGRRTMARARGAPRRRRRTRLRRRRGARALHPAPSADDGEVLEVDARRRIASCSSSAARLVKQGGAALFIDYGHSVTGFGDTLQALRAHRFVDPLADARRMRPHRACRFRRDGAQRRAPPARRSTGRSTRAISCVRSASTCRTKALAERAGPERAEELAAGAQSARRQGRRRDGRAVQGDGGGQPRRCPRRPASSPSPRSQRERSARS